MYAAKGGEVDVYSVPKGFIRPRTKTPYMQDLLAYTRAPLSFEDDIGDVSKGMLHCKRFKRWVGHEQWNRTRGLSGARGLFFFEKGERLI